MADGRELMGYATASGAIVVLGANRRDPQLAMFVVTATHWRPMGDEHQIEEFERD